MGIALAAAVALVPGIRAQTGSVAAPAATVPEGPVGPSRYAIVRRWQQPFAEPGFAFGGRSVC